MFVNKSALLLATAICFTLPNNIFAVAVREQVAHNIAEDHIAEAKKTFPVIDFDPDKQSTMTALNWNIYKSHALARLTNISRGPDVTPPNPSGAAKSAIHENNGINEQAVVAYNDMAKNYNSDPEYYYDLIREIAKEDEEDATSDSPIDSNSTPLPISDYDSNENADQSPKAGAA